MVRIRSPSLWVVASVIFLAGLWILWPKPTLEPVAAGRGLSSWLEQYALSLTSDDQNQSSRKQAETSVKGIGARGIPRLLVMISAKDSALKIGVDRLLQRVPLFSFSAKTASAMNLEAAYGFQILGAEAKEAVPALMGLLNHPISSSSQLSAATALGGIGPAASPAIPALTRAATNSDTDLRLRAIAALRGIHSDPASVVPVLITCLKDPNAVVRSTAAAALGDYGPEAKQAVPDLRQALQDSQKAVRSAAAYALEKADR